MKIKNEYVSCIGKLYDSTPKAVFAAIAISALTCGGDHIELASEKIISEWNALYINGIVPQKPPKSEEEVLSLKN